MPPPRPILLGSFEKLLSPSAMKIGVDDGIGCFADKLPAEERTQAVVPDQFRHEITTTFNLKGRGLVVLTSCSHRGVVNAIRQAQAVSGVHKVHAVIGGFHLAPYKEDYVRETVAALREIDPDYLIPLHCTGEPFYEIAKVEMPTKLVRSYTGTRFVFTTWDACSERPDASSGNFIEGNPYDGHIALEPKVITGAISHLAVVEGATVLRTQSLQEAADLLLSMAKRLQDGRRDLALRPSKPADPRLLAEYIVSGLPRIGRTKASILLRRFGSVRGVFTADAADIAAIRGFGRKTAEAIRAALDTPY
jgi:hypothetical protein